MRAGWMVAVLGVLGCKEDAVVEGPQEDPADASTSAVSTANVEPATSTNVEPEDGTSTSGAEPEPWPGGGFIGDLGASTGRIECSIWDQDCPAGEKCTVAMVDGATEWNAAVCVPVHPQPDRAGDPCMGDVTTGYDSCGVRAFCWDIDPTSELGMCVEFCMGTENNPICAAPDMQCNMDKNFGLAICLPTCDPLINDCPVGCACYGLSDAFQCVPDVSGELGAPGDPCEAINTCDPLTDCVAAEAVDGCAGAVGCCTPYCDTSSAADPCEPPHQCVPYFADGTAPPGYEDVGLCIMAA